MTHRRLASIVLANAVIAAPLAAQTKLYLGEYAFNNPRLYVMEPGGANRQELFIIPTADWLVVGLQIDVAAGRIYWTHGSFNQGRIRSANLDGSDVQPVFSGLTNPRGLALDVAGGKLYWSDTQDRRMYRGNLDGTGMEPIIDTGHQLGNPTLDLAGGKIYYGNYDLMQIRRANLDGSGQEMLFGGVWTGIAIALDLGAGKIYWADSNTSFVSNWIARANFDGSDMEILYDGEPTSSGFTGIELDLPAGKLYWSDEITNIEKGLWEANLDGSGATRIFESPSGWNAGAMTIVPAASAPCPWDLDRDGATGITDLLSLLAQWGTNPGGPPDFDGDGNVGIADLLELLAHWGPCP